MFSPRAVLFDFGGTLDAPGWTWLERARRTYARFGFDTALPTFDRAFYDAATNLTQTFRVLAILLKEGADWRIVQTQWSHGGPIR